MSPVVIIEVPQRELQCSNYFAESADPRSPAARDIARAGRLFEDSVAWPCRGKDHFTQARNPSVHTPPYICISIPSTKGTAVDKNGYHVGNTHLHIYSLGISTPGTQGMAIDKIDSSMQTTPTFIYFIVWPSTGKGSRCSHYLVSHHRPKYAESADAQPRPSARTRPNQRWAPNASWGKRVAPVATVEDRK